MTERHYQIPTLDARMGRHVNHDERSKAFAAEMAALHDIQHTTHGLPLDQGQLGSCTGNAGVGAMSTEPDWYAQTETDEPLAIKLYSQATKEDPYPDEYPPTDTGSDGLTVCKVMKEWSWITSYTHAFGLDHAVGALMLRPVMTGVPWLNDMFNPDADGRVHVSGDVAGGHEFVLVGVEIARTPIVHRVSHSRSKVWAMNSWGSGWGSQGGRFYLTFGDYAELLAEDGDVSVPVR